MASRSLVAQEVMDLYYQQYKTNSDFFNLTDFDYFVGIGWADMLQMEWDQSYAVIRQEGGNDLVSFDHGWLAEQIVKVKRDGDEWWGQLVRPVMSFKSDRNTTGIQNVFPVGNRGCGEILRTTVDQVWHQCYLPVTDKRFWLMEWGKKLRFYNIDQCNLQKVRIIYVPSSEDPELDIPDTKAGPIIEYVLNLMFAAKDKRVVSRVNNLNANKVIQFETDLNAGKQNI
jgi:hypothetical protein